MRRFLGILLLIGTSVSMAQIPAGYYDTAQGKNGAELKTALYNVIKGHTEYPYSASTTDTWDILKETDVDPNNSNNVIGLYSAFSMNAAAEYDGGNGWTREHVWAKSRGDFGTTPGAGTDVHHLRAEDASTNSARSNRNFDEATDQYIDASGQYSGPTPSFTGGSTSFTWEPRDAVKGDVARMLFYMATRYEGEAGEPDLELTETLLTSSDKSPLHAKLSVLLTWHEQDPVDAYEQTRNDIIYGYQGNRNPFIDHPEYVTSIWGSGTPTTPGFTSTPVTTATENVSYTYNITASGGSGTLTLSAPVLPMWLTLTDAGNGTGSLSGTPATLEVGSHPVTLEVTDGTDTDTQSFTITVNAASSGGGSATDLLFSEYIEGSSYNKAIEIANFTGVSVDLSSYVVKKQTNGSGSWSGGIALSGTLADGDVYVLAHSSASAAILAEADYTGASTELTFNGNDALSLHKSGVLIDAIGVFNSTATFGQNVTLVRNADVTSPNATYTTSEWTSYASDDFSHLGTHTMNVAPPNQAPSASITSPSNGSTVTSGDLVTITADASDSDGTVTSVEFFVNSSSIGVDTSAPYASSFTALEGNMDISATATDDGGASNVSATVSIIGEVPAAAGVLYFSEYIEGSSNNKALEVANTSGSAVNMSGYVIKKQANGSGSWSGGIALIGTLNDGDVYVLANASANVEILSKADFTGGNSELTFNGNDAVGLFKDGTLIDILGTFNSAATYAQDVTLRRNDVINAPNDIYTTSEWTSFATDNAAGLGLRYGEEVPNTPPSVSITSPTDGAVYTDGDNVSITANASDTDGTITSVEFFVDGVSIGVDTSSPYSVNWTIGVASYSLSAHATDNDGAITNSVAVSVTGEAAAPAGETLISYDGFESGWGNFSDGGKDAYRSTDASKAYAGTASAGIQDNTSSSVITYTNSVDITAFDQVRIDFNFLAISMENGEDFWVQMYDGSSFVTVATFARGTDFNNNTFYAATVVVDPSSVNFASNMKVRFRCDASGNRDDVYLDEITVTGINSGGARSAGSKSELTALRQTTMDESTLQNDNEDLLIYPNPVVDILNVRLISNETQTIFLIISDMSGKKMYEKDVTTDEATAEIKLDLGSLKNGVYLLNISQGDHMTTRRIFKK
ncbi:endonuclease [Ekhidna sp.]|uniref:endonuclease n=1 Tax=Ekhidna sp. TaxID=2608089 RepID=UPI003B503DA4